MIIQFKIFVDSRGRYLNYVPECEGGAYGIFVEPNKNMPPTLFPIKTDFEELLEESEIDFQGDITYKLIDIETILTEGKSVTNLHIEELPQIIHLSSFTTKNDFEGEGDFDDFEKLL